MSHASELIPELDYGVIAERVNVGVIAGEQGANELDTLFMANGEVRFSHVCRLERSGRVMRIAPLLQIGNGHTIVTRSPLTIVASILCTDCNLHGWVTNGQWVPA
jgi:hypothetical protein